MTNNGQLTGAYTSYYGAEGIGIVGKSLLPITTLSIDCKEIRLTTKEVEITVDVNRQIKEFDTITTNGVKFKKVEE